MREAQNGQILILVMLVMVIVLTIGLSVGARTVMNIRTSSEEANSEQAFSAAEAGIEQSLNKINGVSGSFINNTTYQTTITNVSGISLLLNNGIPILKDDALDIWLSKYPDYTNTYSGNITIYWGQASDNCTASEATNSMAALEVILLSGTKANPKMSHYVLDPCALRVSSNNFEFIAPGGIVINGKTFRYKKTININSGLIARVIPLYASAAIGVTGSNNLPSQGTLYQSVGTADTTQRKIVSLRSYPKLPTELFSYILFSPK